MPRLLDRVASRVRELEAELATFAEGGARAVDLVTPALPELLDADSAMGFVLGAHDDRVRLDEVASAHLPGELARAFDAFLGTQPVDWTNYSPTRPEPAQRNVAMAWEQLRLVTPARSLAEVPVTRHVLSRFGLASHDQLRVLVCDGPALLAWVGATRAAPFGARERRTLQRLVPALRRRRRLEALLPVRGAYRPLFEAAFAAIPSPAFVTSVDGAPLEVNAAGSAWLAREGAAGREELRLAARRLGSAKLTATRVTSPGTAERRLLVLRPSHDARTSHRVAEAARRWGFTPAEARLLALLVEGLTTRTLAATLRCAERTVEARLAAMFAKAQVGSRVALAAAVWR